MAKEVAKLSCCEECGVSCVVVVPEYNIDWLMNDR